MLIDDDFETLAVGLRTLLNLLPPVFREKRASFLNIAKAKWQTLTKKDQDEWAKRLENTRLALLTRSFKSEAKLLETIDALFEGPPRSNLTCSLTTSGNLMAFAHSMWLPFSDLPPTSDFQLAEEAAHRTAINTESFKIMLHSYRWTLTGFPVVKISPRFAAAAMCTTLRPEIQEDLTPPWRAFAVEMPRTPVLYHFPVDDPVQVSHILVLWMETLNKRPWSLWLMSNPEIPSTNRHNLYSTELGAAHIDTEDDQLPWPTIENRDDKALMLGGRILSSVICALTNADMVAESNQKNHRKWKKHPVPAKKASDSQPLIFQITAPVNIDLVDRVVEYQLKHPDSKGWKLNLRMVVRGHWKMQVCDSGRTGRKKIWVQPYERGPKGAPLAVRDHIIVDS
jgi:hypothetical protein